MSRYQPRHAARFDEAAWVRRVHEVATHDVIGRAAICHESCSSRNNHGGKHGAVTVERILAFERCGSREEA